MERMSMSKRSSILKKISRMQYIQPGEIMVPTQAMDKSKIITISTVSLSNFSKKDRDISVFIEFMNNSLGESAKVYYGEEIEDVPVEDKQEKVRRKKEKGQEQRRESKITRVEDDIEKTRLKKKSEKARNKDGAEAKGAKPGNKNDITKKGNETTEDKVQETYSAIENGHSRRESKNRKPRSKIMNESKLSIFETEKGFKVSIPFSVTLKCDPNFLKCINSIVDNPVLFALLLHPNTRTKGNKEPVGDDRPSVVGFCNLDLFPLVLGEKLIEETLFVEQEKKGVGHEMKTWPNLPQLSVTASVAEDLIPPDVFQESNILYFTVESMYNLQQSMTDQLSYQAATQIPLFSDTFEEIHFKEGSWVDTHDTNKIKKWAELMYIPGRASYTKYELGEGFTTLKNALPTEILHEIIKTDAPRVEWNCLKRCWLAKSGVDVFQNTLAKYPYWPLEIQISPNSDGAPHKSRRDQSTDIIHAVAYLDIRTLLYPGIDRVRTAVPLHVYQKHAFGEKTGFQKCLFEVTAPEVKEGTTSRLRKLDLKSMSGKQSSLLSLHPQEGDDNPVILENTAGQPVFIIVEVQLHKPLTRRRSDKELIVSIEDTIPKRVELPKKVMDMKLAEQHYHRAIEEACEVIVTEFKNYVDKKQENETPIPKNTGDLVNDFAVYLHSTEAHQLIKSTLHEKILVLVNEKSSTINLDNQQELHNFVSDAYVYLVEEMHSVINKLIKMDDVCAYRQAYPLSSNQLNYFAEEALEEEDIDTAEKFHLNKLAEDGSNTNYWIKYGVFFLGMGNTGKSKGCINNVLQEDIKSFLGLLLYGIFLCEEEKYDMAETFLDALTRLYPNVTESWIVLHLYYLLLDKQYGADIALKSCYEKLSHNDESFPEEYGDHLSWYPDNYDNSSIFLTTAILLIKLRAYKYAQMALAQELIHYGYSVSYWYYLSVVYYYQGHYMDALKHLDKAVREYSKDYSLWSLYGHCHYRLNNQEKAMEYYKYVLDSDNRPDDVHLVGLRLAQCYLNFKKFEDSKKIFLYVCKFSPTPRSWLGAGIASYELRQYDDAEQALCEANILDNGCAVTWGYLALLNLQLHRESEFTQCYRQALRYKLKDELLKERIKILQTSLKFPDVTKLLPG